MELSAALKMTGSLTIKKYNVEGQLTGDLFIPNLVVTSGKESIANRMTSNDMLPMSHMAIGTSTNGSAATQTDLLTRAQTVAIGSTTVNGTSITYSATFPTFGSIIAMTEAGIFNQSETRSVTFDANLGISSGTINTTVPSTHGFSNTHQVRYTNGGGTSVGGLVDGGIYYVRDVTATSFKLAATSGGTAIALTAGSGTAHKLSYGTMLCRTTFPVLQKATSDTVVISWTVTVG